ncbi:MAG: restriction endonuclease subunit S [Desulfobacteraceae bacterium]|jgi:type I restriction enzyme S subunit|nr:restriction endonuclease subunit S [Desulfobacteraceae bacterium]
MKYGLSDEQLKQALDIIASYDEIEEAILFGSRAIDTYKEASDVDISLKGTKVTASLAAKLKFHFEEDTYLPFFFDFIAYPTITNEAMKEHINTKGVVIYRKGWRECKLGDAPIEIIDGDRGKHYPKKDEFFGKGYCLFLNTKNVTTSGFSFSELNFITKEKDALLRKGKLERYDLVLTTRGTVGNLGFFNDKVIYDKLRINSGMVIIRPKGINKYFNYQLFKYLKKDFETFTTGSAQPQLPIRDLKEMSFSLPPLPEQKAIASVLSSLDDKIDLLHRQNKTLEAMAETLFRQWFVEEAKDDWEDAKLEELLDITSSKRIFYKEYVPFGVPFYRSKEIIELHNTGITNGELYITENRFDEISEKFGAPIQGDILLTSVGTLGIPYRVKKNDKFYFKDGNLTWFKNFKGIPSIIIYFWIKSNVGKEQLDAITIGSTQAALTISGLKEIILSIPPIEKLKKVESHLEHIYNRIEYNQSQILTLKKLRDTLLPKLMSGEVRVEHEN